MTGLELEQRGDEDEELAARVQVELVALGQALDERHDDRGHVDLGRLDRLLQEQRQQQVERALEGVEVQLEIADGTGHAATLAAGPDAAAGDAHLRPCRTARPLPRALSLRPPIPLGQHEPDQPSDEPKAGHPRVHS